MYELNQGKNKLAEWSMDDIQTEKNDPLKTSSFRVEPDFEKEIMEFVDSSETPFTSRSEMVRVSCRAMINFLEEVLPK